MSSAGRWPRMTLTLPVATDLEVRATMPRHMTADEWSRMLGLLDVMRPGIVKESPEKERKSATNNADKGDS
jgi:hypothetical protein